MFIISQFSFIFNNKPNKKLICRSFSQVFLNVGIE